jgi:protocatechuate 3,4-dioxygenase beta subunit
VILCVLLLAALVLLLMRDSSRQQQLRGAAAFMEQGAHVRESTSLALPQEPERAALASKPMPEFALSTEFAEPIAGMHTVRVLVVDKHDATQLQSARVESFEGTISSVNTTDEHGVCPIEARIDAKSLRLDVMSDGYFHWNATFPNRAEVEIGLRRAVAFSGRVLDREDRTPIPGAQISFEHIHCARCSPTSVLAGLDGEFLMSDLPDGESYFIVVAAGYPTASIPLEFEIDDPQSRQDLLLTRGVLLRGEVLDFVTGDALPGALIGLEDNWISSDASGRFVGLFAPSEDGSLLLVVNLKPRCTLNVRLSPDDLARKEPLRLRLPQSPIVEVRILDSNGAAIKGARILVSRDGFALGREQQNPKRAKSPLDELPASWTLHDHSYGRGRSDAAGLYEIRGLVPWGKYRWLSVELEGFGIEARDLERMPGPGQSIGVEIVLQREL